MDIDRPLYMDRVAPFIGNDNAKVITGIRRCGKSTILRCLSETIAEEDVNVIFIDMELWDNRELRDPDALYKKIKKNIVPDKRNALFMDEVQDVTEWESVIRSLISEKACDIYLTGSNSRLLSSEYSTYLTGRLNTLEMFPLSLRECGDFNDTFGKPLDNDSLLKKYLRVGGFPSVWRGEYDGDSAESMLQDILSTVMMKDVISRHNVKNPDLLDRIFRFVCDNIGKYTSLNNMYNVLQSEDRSVSKNSVYSYMGHLESAYLVQKANVYDIRGKRILSSKYKYFLTDIGLKHAALGFRPDDIPGHMENIIFTDLRSRGYRVWVGDNNGKEIDLVGERLGRKVYVQSAFRMSSENVMRREYGNLKDIDDNYSKYVVTMDPYLDDGDSDGIITIGLAEFLMKDVL